MTSGGVQTDQRARWLGQAAAREREERCDVAEADRWRQRGGMAASSASSGAEADGGWRQARGWRRTSGGEKKRERESTGGARKIGSSSDAGVA
ncbi:hypothetical protein Syun_023503 [Stephania yunnanensis]|uniref:Uncharacterized protein n=1 Tax=Stephania yunnanensis TaxID=152371 RepID=A0AAP0FIH9_9MAGN